MKPNTDLDALALGSDGPLWSLSYEFWYYLLFPVLLLAVIKDQSWQMRLLYLCIAGAICLLVGPAILAYFAVWLMGSAVAVLEMRGVTWRGGGGAVGQSALGLVFLCIVAAAHVNPFGVSGYWSSVTIAAAFSAWLWAIVSNKSSFSDQNAASPLTIALTRAATFLADRSYTLYLVHAPMLVFLNAMLLPQGNLWQPDRNHVLIAGGILMGVLAYASTVGLLTEAHTDRVRAWAESAHRKA